MSCELEFRVGVANCEKKNAKIKLNVARDGEATSLLQ